MSVNFNPINSYSAKLDGTAITTTGGDIVITYPPPGNGMSIIPITYIQPPSTGRGTCLLMVQFINGAVDAGSSYILGSNSTTGSCNVTSISGNNITVSTSYSVGVLSFRLGNPIVFRE